ncbi:MAG TPA: hypothetical protein VFJ77_02830 [Gaiellaceae bacterium]|nr:hypothetical protein [Gaiellaceae bacterium]
MFAIWVNTMPGDSRSAWPKTMFRDARVSSYWDPADRVGRWFGVNGTGGIGTRTVPVVWDAYFAYGPDARWQDAPTEPVVAGSEIISHTQELTDRFVPLLG